MAEHGSGPCKINENRRLEAPKESSMFVSEKRSLLVLPAPGGVLTTTVAEFLGQCGGPVELNGFSHYGPPMGGEFTAGPRALGQPGGEGVEYTASSANSVIWDNGYGLVDNGMWLPDRQYYLGVNRGVSEYIDLEFENDKCCAGGLINYSVRQGVPDNGPPLLEILDSNDVVLASKDLEADLGTRIRTNGAISAGEFRGFHRDACDIRKLRIKGAFMVLDDLRFSTAAMAGTGGDPHVKTWSGEWFDFMGEWYVHIGSVVSLLDVHCSSLTSCASLSVT